MITAAANAERIRFISTRGWVPGVLVILVTGLILPARYALAVASDPGLPPASDASAMIPVTGAGVLGLAAGAAWAVGREYTAQTADLLLLMQPSRWRWLAATTMVQSLVASAFAALSAFLSVLVVWLLTTPDRQEGLNPLASTPMVARAAVISALVVVIAVSVASILRRTWAALAVVVGWPLLGERLLANQPAAWNYLLGVNIRTGICGPTGAAVASWGVTGATMYLAGIAAAALAAAAVVARLR